MIFLFFASSSSFWCSASVANTVIFMGLWLTEFIFELLACI